MEGRAIARPNTTPRSTSWLRRWTLQWRAGQLPGQTYGSSRGFRDVRSLQWRAGQLPGQTRGAAASCDGEAALQWRAGQLPGQTRDCHHDQPPSLDPSMAGRAIARPNWIVGRSIRFRRRMPSMEGRAIARPNPAHTPRPATPTQPFNGGPGNCPAKPQRPVVSQIEVIILQWRAGQLPGQTAEATFSQSLGITLQWRAGQLPGQTDLLIAVGNVSLAPSMEGRAIARPNPQHRPRLLARPHAFNGGPGNCPAKRAAGPGRERHLHRPSMEGRAIARPNRPPHECGGDHPRASMEGRAIARPNRVSDDSVMRSQRLLQWRAGQLPGQTLYSPALPASRCRSFNGGPGNCPAKRAAAVSPRPSGGNRFNGGPGNCPAKPSTVVLPALTVPKLQWRAGQLPGQTRLCWCGPGVSSDALQWRAGQLPGQTRARRPSRASMPTSFNGGPGNCPAKRGPDIGPGHRRDLASMEGRAIARPNRLWPMSRSRMRRVLQWRAGQLPGQTLDAAGVDVLVNRLQWRAGQLPGQTMCSPIPVDARTRCFNGGPGNCPAKRRRHRHCRHRQQRASMEGRAIARPNSTEPRSSQDRHPGFNGGPGNCPAKPHWPPPQPRPEHFSFNGGPGNCPAKRRLGRRWC